MEGTTLTPDLERVAAEALTSDRYRDLSAVMAAGVRMLQRPEAARAALLASVVAAQEEGDRAGYLTADDLVAHVEARLAGRPRRGEWPPAYRPVGSARCRGRD